MLGVCAEGARRCLHNLWILHGLIVGLMHAGCNGCLLLQNAAKRSGKNCELQEHGGGVVPPVPFARRDGTWVQKDGLTGGWLCLTIIT